MYLQGFHILSCQTTGLIPLPYPPPPFMYLQGFRIVSWTTGLTIYSSSYDGIGVCVCVCSTLAVAAWASPLRNRLTSDCMQPPSLTRNSFCIPLPVDRPLPLFLLISPSLSSSVR